MKSLTLKKRIITILGATTLSLLVLLLAACSSDSDNGTGVAGDSGGNGDDLAELQKQLVGQWTASCIDGGDKGFMPYITFLSKETKKTISSGLIKFPDNSCSHGGKATNPAHPYEIQPAITTPSGLTAYPVDIPQANLKSLLSLQGKKLYMTKGQDGASNYPNDISELSMKYPYTKAFGGSSQN